ncbi:MAG: mechanosensitive ion channel protein MscS [Chloroflexi bacterium HGW-Chloroflexi-10]|nr:MAG: mechanosensitive ion channel protein MscS [Chloroflexi bacterium HGW-Chloroflexi-10]
MIDYEILRIWIQENPAMAAGALLLLCAILFFFTRQVLIKGLLAISARTKNKTDDILVRHIHPLRVAWLAPFILVYALAYLFPDFQIILSKAALFFILWITALTINGILNAVNEIYESSKNYNGVSIQSYLDLAKILFFIITLILSVTILTGQSPIVLLTGLGAITAVLLLVFQGTILSLVASIQIVANDLLKEGDWIEVPSYGADGDVVNVNLHAIKVRNFDMTYTVIPTYKIVDVAYKNWRGMQESGGRRIQRSLSVDMLSIKFCNESLLARLGKIDLISDLITKKISELNTYQKEHAEHFDEALDGPQITNIEIFRSYIVSYLKNRSDIIQEGMPFLVRSLSPTTSGLPIEIYVFARTTEWLKYEMIQAEIFDHLMAAAQIFDLRIFQTPSGLDFSQLGKSFNP